MLRELERRTRELFPDEPTKDHLDYAEHYIANGGTLVSLAKSLAGSTGTHVMRETLRRYLHKPDGAEGRLANARIHASHALVEEAADMADGEYDRDDVPNVKYKTDTKLKIAQLFNRGEFGEQKSANVTINLGVLHLDALRNREVEVIGEAEEIQPERIAA